MKVHELFLGWFRQAKADRLADWLGADILDREVRDVQESSGHGAEGEIPLTVHRVVFGGPAVARREHTKQRETWVEGNALSYPT